jgi:hypothetical protein
MDAKQKMSQHYIPRNHTLCFYGSGDMPFFIR